MTPPLPRLTIELVPEGQWYTNVRSAVSRADWEKCKRFVRERSGDRCEICGGRGAKWPVECHEVWDYNARSLEQTLVDLIALCPDCHRVKHLGRTTTVGGVQALARSIDHMCAVNDWEPEDAEQYIKTAFVLHTASSALDWKLNLDYLAMLGIPVPEVG